MPQFEFIGFHPTTRSIAGSVKTASSAVSTGLAGNEIAFQPAEMSSTNGSRCVTLKVNFCPSSLLSAASRALNTTVCSP